MTQMSAACGISVFQNIKRQKRCQLRDLIRSTTAAPTRHVLTANGRTGQRSPRPGRTRGARLRQRDLLRGLQERAVLAQRDQEPQLFQVEPGDDRVERWGHAWVAQML